RLLAVPVAALLGEAGFAPALGLTELPGLVTVRAPPPAGAAAARVTLYQGVGYARPDYLRDIASLLAFLRERYVGRERELARIDAFLADPAGGYLLVEAPGGFGKSVLVGQLVDRALGGRLPTRPAQVCCFLRIDGARNTTVAFLQAVNAQLLGLL